MANIVVWADIPVTYMPRAIEFYQRFTGYPVSMMPGSNDTVALIASAAGSEAEMVVSADLYLGGTPSHDGPRVYFGSGGDIDGMAARAVEAGGKILQEKQFMGDTVGWIVFIEDSEGNRIGIQEPGK